MAEEIDFLINESANSDLIIRLDDAQRKQPDDSTYRDHKAPELEALLSASSQ